MITHRLGVAHIYYCIPVFLQFHQIELITKRQLDKENKRNKKKMENEMLKRAGENRSSKHANTQLIIKVTSLTKPRQLLQMDNIKQHKQIRMQTDNKGHISAHHGSKNCSLKPSIWLLASQCQHPKLRLMSCELCKTCETQHAISLVANEWITSDHIYVRFEANYISKMTIKERKNM